MVSVCLPSDALLQYLPSYLGFSYLGLGVSLQGCSCKAQLLLLTLDEGYLLIAALSDLQHGIASLGPPGPTQPPLLGHEVAPPSRRPWPWGRVAPHGRPWPRTQGSSSLPPLVHQSQLPALSCVGCILNSKPHSTVISTTPYCFYQLK